LRSDTIIALATPPGSGALAIIRLSGSRAIALVNSVFRGKDLSLQESHTLHFGRIMDGGQVLDEVVVSLFIAPRSYTREDVVELSTHGSSYIIRSIISLLIRKGARAADPGEFTLRAFMNGAMDLSQAEAVADLIASNSRASHQLALQQMRGGFSGELQGLRTRLIHFASLIELELDFSEEDVEFANRDMLKQLIMEILRVLHQLIASFEQGNVLKNGVPVVIAGKPNVGKSTLLNAMLNEERAIVSEIAGTTRDTIEDEITLNGVVFRFIDTAGLRATSDVIEAEGVERTRQKMKQARLIIYLIDPLQSQDEIVTQLQELQTIDIPSLLVVNKSDLSEPVNPLPAGNTPVFISAKNKTGLEELERRILEKTGMHQLDSGNILITNARHLEALQRTEAALEQVLSGIDNPVTSDFLAIDIRQALHYLGEITGEVTTDDLLENIFSKFCIGK
jgi:tRNA modification GTPase